MKNNLGSFVVVLFGFFLGFMATSCVKRAHASSVGTNLMVGITSGIIANLSSPEINRIFTQGYMDKNIFYSCFKGNSLGDKGQKNYVNRFYINGRNVVTGPSFDFCFGTSKQRFQKVKVDALNSKFSEVVEQGFEELFLHEISNSIYKLCDRSNFKCKRYSNGKRSRVSFLNPGCDIIQKSSKTYLGRDKGNDYYDIVNSYIFVCKS